MSGVLFTLSPVLFPPNEDSLNRRFDLFLRRQITRKQRPKARAAAPRLATTTPAICGLVSTGVGPATAEVDAAAAVTFVFVEEGDDVVGMVDGVFVVERAEECREDKLVIVVIVDLDRDAALDAEVESEELV